MSKVFVIGNGPSALTYKLGKEIDAADIVVRINNFQTAGFEEFVGTKTDILFTCRLNEYLETLHQFPEVNLCLLMNPLDGVTIPEELLQSPNIKRVIDWDEVNSLLPSLNLGPECYPSTGLICVLEMIGRFDHVHVTGFDHFGHQNRHYYSNLFRQKPTRHDAMAERFWFRKLNEGGLLTYAGEPEFYKYDGHAANLNP